MQKSQQQQTQKTQQTQKSQQRQQQEQKSRMSEETERKIETRIATEVWRVIAQSNSEIETKRIKAEAHAATPQRCENER